MKDLNTVIDEIVQKAKEELPFYLWEPQTALSKILVTVPAKSVHNLYVVSEYIKNLMSFNGLKYILTNEEFKESFKSALGMTENNYWNLVKEDLNNIGLNYGIKRKEARPARGVIDLYFSNSNPVNISRGTIFTAVNGLKFSTVKDFSLSPVLDSESNLYKASVVVEANVAGANGNIPAGFISSCDVFIPNLVKIENPYSFYNGVDEEADLEYLIRFYNAVYYNSLGSTQWLLNLMLAQDNVLDAIVLGPQDSNFKRRYGADIWVVSNEEEIVNYSEDADSVYVDYPPVISYDNANIIEGDPEVNIYARSIYDMVQLVRIDNAQPITYSIDLTIYKLQQIVLNPDYYFFAPERTVIVRKALPADIFVHVVVYPNYGVDETELQNNIKQDLQIFFTGGTLSYGKFVERKKIGKGIDVSDILQVIVDNPNVDRVDLDDFEVYIDRGGMPDYPVYGQLILKFYEYPVLSASTEVIIK